MDEAQEELLVASGTFDGALVTSSDFDGDPEDDGIDLMVSITLFNRWTISASHFPAEDGHGVSEDDVVRLCDAVAVAAKAMFT